MPWFDDAHRFGAGGFARLDDGRFLFARYPSLFETLRGEARTVMHAPWLPHAIAADGPTGFLLASTIAPGSDEDIRPRLWRRTGDTLELIWSGTPEAGRP